MSALFVFLVQTEVKHGREDYILTPDEMYENDFPLPTDVNKDTGETEHEGMSREHHKDIYRMCFFF